MNQIFCTHVSYIHFNPVKHGLVKEVIDWPYTILVASNQATLAIERLRHESLLLSTA
ncbi:TPA: hypothetical protein ACPSKB_001645 [Legionella feeleii]